MGEKKISYAEISYLCYFLVLFGAKAIGLYEGMFLFNLSIVAGVLLFGVKILLTKHTILEYVMIISMSLLSMIVYYNTGEKGLLLYITMMLGMKGVSLSRIFKWATLILGTCFAILVFLTSFGFVQDIYYTKDRAFFGMIMRRSLGYPYPNTLFTTYIILMVLIMYVLGKMNKKQLLAVSLLEFAGAVYMFLYSCSNTGIIVATAFLILNYYFQTRKSLSFIEKLLIQLVYPACILVSVAGPVVAKGKLFQILDKILHNRMRYSNYFLTNEPITLLGQRFKPAPDPEHIIDSSFLYSFLQIGIVAFILVTALNLLMIHDRAKHEKRVDLAIIISFCILGLSDPFFFNLSYKNILFLFIGEYFYRTLKKGKSHLPPFFSKEIQWLKIGSKEIVTDKLCPGRIREVAVMAGSRLKKEYIYYTVLFFISWMIIAGFYFIAGNIMDKNVIADNVMKWEYIRMGINTGMWGAFLSVLLSVLRKEKIGYK